MVRTLMLTAALVSALVLTGCGGKKSGAGNTGSKQVAAAPVDPAAVDAEGMFTDPRDGQRYSAVGIGNLIWMAQNLNFPADNSWCYGGDDANCAKYGRLYTIAAARTACPAPWRLPTDDDWHNLMDAGGGKDVAAKKLKSKTGWDICAEDGDENKLVSCDGNGTDDFGFSATPSGGCLTAGNCKYLGLLAGWWRDAEKDNGGRIFGVVSHDDGLDGDSADENAGFSVRCVTGILPDDSDIVVNTEAAARTAEKLAQAAAQEAAEAVALAKAQEAERIADSLQAAFTMAAAAGPNPVPAGYRLFETITGDLNGDGLIDVVLIIKGTDKNKIVKCEEPGESGALANRMVDINERGIIIDFKTADGYKRVLENRNCLASELDDHLREYPYNIRIDKGSLFIGYWSSRFDECIYNFRYRNSDFELIGYDHHELGASRTVVRTTSVNFLSRKALLKERPDHNSRFMETWKNFTVQALPKLRDEKYIGCIDVLPKLGLE